MADFEKQVSLIEVDIDVAQAKKEVDELTLNILNNTKAVKANSDEIKTLEKTNKSLSDEVKKGKKTTEEVNKEYLKNEKAISELTVQNAALKDSTKDLNRERAAAVKATKLQSNSLGALRKRSAELKKQLNEQEIATESGRKAFDKLQSELKDTNEQIKELDQGAGDFTTTIGDYAGSLTGSAKVTELFNDGLGGVAKGFKGATVQALRFLATPIGAVLGAIVAAFLLVKNAMDRNEESANKITKAFSAFEGIINFVLKALEPLGELLIDGIVKGFELAGEAAEGAMSLISQGLSALGFEDAAESVDEFTESITEAVVASSELADMEAKLQVEQRKSARLQLEFQKEAEKLRQIRDDESLQISERIEANEKLSRVLAKQLAEERKIADLRLNAVNARIEMEGETTELLDARAEALTEIADIEERITGQESEQLTNRNALLKEQKEKQEELAEQAKQREIEAEEAVKAEEDRALRRLEAQKNLNDKLRELEIAKMAKDAETFEEQEELEKERFENELERLAEEEALLAEQELEFEEDRAAAKTEIDLAREEALQQHEQTMVDISAAAQAERLKNLQAEATKAKNIVGTSQNAMTDILTTASNVTEQRYRERFKNIEQQLSNGQITEEEFAKKKEALERKQAMDAWRIQKGQFVVDKIAGISTAAINTAQSIAKAVNAFPATGGMPFAAINGALGALQIAAIASKPAPPRPTFAEGGVVINGRSHAQGGEDIHVGGRLVGNMQGGEGIFVTKREATMAMLNDYNISAGGNSMFSNSHRFVQEGGSLDTSSQAMSAEDLAVVIAEMPTPVVEVRSIMAGINAENEATGIGTI